MPDGNRETLELTQTARTGRTWYDCSPNKPQRADSVHDTKGPGLPSGMTFKQWTANGCTGPDMGALNLIQEGHAPGNCLHQAWIRHVAGRERQTVTFGNLLSLLVLRRSIPLQRESERNFAYTSGRITQHIDGAGAPDLYRSGDSSRRRVLEQHRAHQGLLHFGKKLLHAQPRGNFTRRGGRHGTSRPL